jgi:hypothetical protein
MKEIKEMSIEELREELNNYRDTEAQGMECYSSRDIQRKHSIQNEYENKLNKGEDNE